MAYQGIDYQIIMLYKIFPDFKNCYFSLLRELQVRQQDHLKLVVEKAT